MPAVMQEMPAIWDDQELLFSRSALSGQLANWAVRQSPYDYPEHLAKGLDEFRAAFEPLNSPQIWPVEEYFHASCDTLLSAIRMAFDSCPTILGWNRPKIPVSCNSSPSDPDCNFIGLDALARNMAHSMTLDTKYEAANDL